MSKRKKLYHSGYREGGGSFTHQGTEYDLDHALSLADKQPVTSTRVKDLAWVLRHGKADPERVRRADLSAPLLVSYTSAGRPTVVDGFHRLTKANNEGVASVPTRFVDRKELRKASAMRYASTMKLASKRFRHRAGLIIRDDQGRILVSEASPERVAKGISRISLPGGGIHENENETRVPTKREIISAARKEALEELGMRIRNPRVLGSHSGELEDWWKDQQEKKRGVRFDGAAEHFVLASPGRKDMSLYNVEGDAFPGRYRDVTYLTPLMEQDARRDSAFAQFNKKQLELLRGLQDTSGAATKAQKVSVRTKRR